MKKTNARTPKRRSDGIRRAPGPIGRSVRVVDRGLPPSFFEDAPRRCTSRRTAAVRVADIDEVTIRRSPGGPPTRPTRTGTTRRPPRNY